MISKNQLTTLPKDNSYFLKMKLELKIKHKFNKLLQKDWFIVDEYYPSEDSINEIQRFFEKLVNNPKINEFILKKETKIYRSVI